jgi:hypothetical protein
MAKADAVAAAKAPGANEKLFLKIYLWVVVMQGGAVELRHLDSYLSPS